jgi:hypothetical protein
MLRNETDFVVCRTTVSVDDRRDLVYVQTFATESTTKQRENTTNVRVRALDIIELSVTSKARKYLKAINVTSTFCKGSKLTILLRRHKVPLLYPLLVLQSPFHSFCFPAWSIIGVHFRFQ